MDCGDGSAASSASAPPDGTVARAAAFGRHRAGAGSVGSPRPARGAAPAGASDQPGRSRPRDFVAAGREGLPDADVARLEQLYAAARAEEWAEFDADCGKYLAELDKEERLAKYTLAELEEEEQSPTGYAAGIGSCAAAICWDSGNNGLGHGPEALRGTIRNLRRTRIRPSAALASTRKEAPGSITREKMIMFRPKDWLDRLFAIGVIGKGLNGLAELIGGLLPALRDARPHFISWQRY